MEKNKIKVWDEEFAIVKSNKIYENAFANIKDKDEITVIIEKSKINDDAIKVDGGWKLITIDIVLDFSVVGFISKISSALAKENISLMVISSYSRDHLLVKEEHLEKTLNVLGGLDL